MNQFSNLVTQTYESSNFLWSVFQLFLEPNLEYRPKKYAIRMGINEKAFSKRPYSENATNIEAEIIIKIKSNSLFFI